MSKCLALASFVLGLWTTVAAAPSFAEPEQPAALTPAETADAFNESNVEANAYGEIICIVENLRGARYYGSAWDYDAYNRACNDAMDLCYRDTIIKRSCHVIYSGPRNNDPSNGGGNGGGRFCSRDWDTRDATPCGAPDGNGRQWYCSPRNNWCVLP